MLVFKQETHVSIFPHTIQALKSSFWNKRVFGTVNRGNFHDCLRHTATTTTTTTLTQCNDEHV